MNKALLLFSKKSFLSKQANPEALVRLLNNLSDSRLSYEWEYYDNLLFYIDNNNTNIFSNKIRVDDFKVIYHRRWGDMPDEALAVYLYANKKHIIQIDSELNRRGSTNKLTQLFRLWQDNLPIPKTIFMNDSQFGVNEIIDSEIRYPCVVKSTEGTRGSDNFLVKNKQEMNKILKNKKLKFLIQEYIPNDGDYRVFICGNEDKLIIHRQAKAGEYKNNISLGGTANLVDAKLLPEYIIADSVKAAKTFNRDIAGVDVVIDSVTGKHYFFEVNRSPQIEGSSYEEVKAKSLDSYLNYLINSGGPMNKTIVNLQTLGTSTYVDFANFKNLKYISARIDTGARTSSLWATDVKITGDKVKFKVFGPGSDYYTGKYVTMPFVEHRVVTSSTGQEQERIVVKFPINIKGKKIQAKFTLSDRSTQSYPVLIGRNTLRGHFLVDCSDPGEATIYKYPEEINEFREVEL